MGRTPKSETKSEIDLSPKAEKRKEPGSGSKQRAASAKKKHIAGQGTLAMAFSKSTKAEDTSPPLEQTSRSPCLHPNESTSLEHIIGPYGEAINKKRRLIPAFDETALPGRPVRRTRRSPVDFDLDAPVDNAVKLELDKALGDEYAYRYICKLNEVTDSSVMPTKNQLNVIVAIMRNHGLHARKDLGVQALNLLRRVDRLHPAVKVAKLSDGLPYLVTDTGAWNFTACCETFNLDAFPLEESDRRVTPFQVLDHLVTLMHSAVIPSAEAGKVTARSTELTSGDLLLTRWIIQQLNQDLQCRLEVFEGRSGKGTPKAKRQSLLQNCQLWRTFSDSSLSGQAHDQKILVRKLMDIISVPESEEVVKPTRLEEVAFNPEQLSSMAAELLRMLLQLYGTAEDTGMFLKHTLSRASSAGALENVRMIIEDALLEGFAGATNISIPERRIFLHSLHPKDQLRLLTMVVAVKHAKRKTDKDNYPGLEDFNRLKNEPGSADAYLVPRPLEALNYILDELNSTSLAYSMINKTGDGLALLVSGLCRSAALQLPGSELNALGTVLGKIVSIMIENCNTTDGKNTYKALSPESVVSLQAARMAIKTK